jgi:membrane protease YdiL (CAAX protease family)
VFSILITAMMLFGFLHIGYRIVENLSLELGTLPDPSAAGHQPNRYAQYRYLETFDDRIVLPNAPGQWIAEPLSQGLSLQLLILLVASLIVTLGSKELAQPDWDLEWLVTLPAKMSTLLAVRIAERTVVNPAAWVVIWPFLSIVAWHVGHRYWAPILGALVMLAVLPLTATLRTLVDTGLRLHVSPPKLRNLQALISVSGVLVYYVAMAASFPGPSFLLDWARQLPSFVQWLPPGLAVRALTAASWTSALRDFALLLGQVALLVMAGLAVLRWQLREGVVGGGVREVGRRKALEEVVSTVTPLTGPLSPVQRRELRLLGRDRNFLVQTLLLPLIIVGMQLVFNRSGNAFEALVQVPERMAAVAFGIAAYALMFSAFQTLNTEGQALWILYCVPQPLAEVLKQKALLWGSVSLLYPLLIFGLGAVALGSVTGDVLLLAGIVFVGVPIYALIATSLGVFACDPLAQNPQQKIRISYTYLYMLLSSLYVYAIFSPSQWQRIVVIVLVSLLALALWQKSKDHLPYLLDSTAAPPASVALADGMIAAMLFFVLQGMAALFLVHIVELAPSGRVIFLAYSIAGALAFLILRYVYWRSKTMGVPRLFGQGIQRGVVRGVAYGIVGAVVGLGYMACLSRFHWLEIATEESAWAGPDLALWLTLVAVVAAPFCEEFIFRGLIFGGLRRLVGCWPSVLASAAIFAIVHPAVSALPVFVLGVCAALAYEATGMLLAPILTHAIYNAAVVGVQWLEVG